MTDYVLVGHPLNVTDLLLEPTTAEKLHNAFGLVGVGGIVIDNLDDLSEIKLAGILVRGLFAIDDLYPSDDLYPVA
jgi:hypothetical protein